MVSIIYLVILETVNELILVKGIILAALISAAGEISPRDLPLKT